MLVDWAKEGVPDMPEAEYSHHVVVLGGSAEVWDDLAQVPDGWADEIIAINDVGCHYTGHLHHWCSLHPEKFPAWEAVRKALGHPQGYKKWGRTVPHGVDPGPVDEIVEHWGGSSAGLAVKIALKELGATEVVLCGCPQTNTPHYHNNRAWEHWNNYWADWQRLAGDGTLVNVKSMSGRTRELLGAPAWIS